MAGIVVLALLIVLALSPAAMYWMRKDPERMVGVASGAFGVVGSLTGAFFGIKIGSRNSKDSMEHVERVMGMMSDSSKNPGGRASSSEERPRFQGLFACGPCRDRTCDLGIKSPLLYQLS